MATLDRLTPEQEALIPVVRDEWLGHGLSCEPADRPAAEEGVREAYRLVGLTPPRMIVWLDSPLAGTIGAAIMAAPIVRGQVRGQVWGQVGGQVGDQVWGQVGRSLWGQHDAGWLSWCDFWDRIGLDVSRQSAGLRAVARAAGWWWTFEGVAIVTERPRALHRDPEGRLHCDDGPALVYPDGWGIWAIHGVRVPERVVMAPETLTVEEIRGEQNAEVRRVMTERYGLTRWLRDAGAEQVHEDEAGILWRMDMGDGEREGLMVEVVNSTPEPDGEHRRYVLRVHPELRPLGMDGEPRGNPQALTARNAVASTFGLVGEEYLVAAES